jgi:hypothetical protein
MSTATIDPYGDATKVPARVEVTNRPLRNLVSMHADWVVHFLRAFDPALPILRAYL